MINKKIIPGLLIIFLSVVALVYSETDMQKMHSLAGLAYGATLVVLELFFNLDSAVIAKQNKVEWK